MGKSRLSVDEFCDLVRRVVEELPEAFQERLENVVVDVEPRPSARVLRSLGMREDDLLLGLFEGSPLTEQSYGENVPNRVVLYQRPIESVCRSRGEIAYEIRRTVMHELAHHFGFSEEDLEFYEAAPSPFDDDDPA